MSPSFESIGSSISSVGGGKLFTGACECGTWFKAVTVKKNEVACLKCKAVKTV